MYSKPRDMGKLLFFFKPKDAETELLEILSENTELIPSEDQQSQHLCTS